MQQLVLLLLKVKNIVWSDKITIITCQQEYIIFVVDSTSSADNFVINRHDH